MSNDNDNPEMQFVDEEVRTIINKFPFGTNLFLGTATVMQLVVELRKLNAYLRDLPRDWEGRIKWVEGK